MIYIITALHIDNNKIKRVCSVGYFNDQKEAIKCLKNNQGDLNEAGHYNHGLIEQYDEGLYSIANNRWLYKWDHTTEKYNLIEQEPTCMHGIFNIALN